MKLLVDPRTYLSVISLAGTEQGLQRVIARDNEARKVHEKLARDIEEDEEEVDAGDSQKGIDLGNRRLLLEVVEGRILGQLYRGPVSHSALRRRRSMLCGGKRRTSLSICPI